jgi:class I fructose-bisphosphate aldolase
VQSAYNAGASWAIRDGGGNGSIIGRNTFQRPKDEALDIRGEIIKIYEGKD